MNKSVNVAGRLLLQGVQKPDNRVLELGAVSASEMLHGFSRIVHNTRRVSTQGENKLAEVDKILALEIGHSALSVKLHNVKYSTGIDAKTVLSSNENLARLEDPSGKTIVMNGLDSVGDLGHVAPENLLRDMGVGSRLLEAIADSHVPSAKMLLRQGLGKRVVVGHKDQRAVLEAATSECIMHSNHAAIANALPSLDRADSLFIGKAETWTC